MLEYRQKYSSDARLYGFAVRRIELHYVSWPVFSFVFSSGFVVDISNFLMESS